MDINSYYAYGWALIGLGMWLSRGRGRQFLGELSSHVGFALVVVASIADRSMSLKDIYIKILSTFLLLVILYHIMRYEHPPWWRDYGGQGLEFIVGLILTSLNFDLN